jgi:hypothetical protein
MKILLRVLSVCLFVTPAHASPFFKLNDTTKKIVLFMSDSSAPASGKTGLTVTVRVSKNGAAFGAGGGTVAELEGGFYAYTPASGDMDTLGTLAIRATATGAVDYVGLREIVAFDPFSASSLGLSNLDATVSSRSTYAGADTSGTATLLSRVTSTRATNLDNLDAAVSSRMATFTLPTNFSLLVVDANGRVDVSKLSGTAQTARDLGANLDTTVSSRSTYAGTDTAGTATLLTRLTSTRAANLDNLDATVSSRSTYAGADTAGTTTLLSRLTATRAGYLDNLSVAPPTAAAITTAVWSEPLGAYNTAGTAGKSLMTAGNAADPWAALLPGSYTGHQAGNIIARLDIPPASAFVAAVPTAPTDVTLCRVYGYLETLDNKPAANVVLSFTLATVSPIKSERLITGRTVTAKTDSQGRVADSAANPYIDLQRNDHLAPAGSKYLVNCEALALRNKEITLAADTFDLASVVP